MVYLEILEGETPADARPVLVTRDPEILRAVADALRSRVAGAAADASTRAALELVDDAADRDPDDDAS